MNADYERRQRDGKWPSRGRWNPNGLPDWYVELIGGLARDLTAWRGPHDPGQHLDPRTDPRCRSHRIERRAAR